MSCNLGQQSEKRKAQNGVMIFCFFEELAKNNFLVRGPSSAMAKAEQREAP
jgi:hypothetical protein